MLRSGCSFVYENLVDRVVQHVAALKHARDCHCRVHLEFSYNDTPLNVIECEGTKTCSIFADESKEIADENADRNGFKTNICRCRIFEQQDAPWKRERSDFKNFSARLLTHFKQPARNSIRIQKMRQQQNARLQCQARPSPKAENRAAWKGAEWNTRDTDSRMQIEHVQVLYLWMS